MSNEQVRFVRAAKEPSCAQGLGGCRQSSAEPDGPGRALKCVFKVLRSLLHSLVSSWTALCRQSSHSAMEKMVKRLSYQACPLTGAKGSPPNGLWYRLFTNCERKGPGRWLSLSEAFASQSWQPEFDSCNPWWKERYQSWKLLPPHTGGQLFKPLW